MIPSRNPFKDRDHQTWGPAVRSFVIAPNDNADLPSAIRAITIGSNGGTISYVSEADGQIYETAPLPIGTYAVNIKRVRLTGTSALGLTGWV